ncbi:hypothetical protein [Arsenicibacter rosenii]|uniref:Uncharacterized protein n=1 Tax=Arsenicibacter rosenii TaxID=1750698 RepID=A0A1S2VC62_9BACT|nr:hypothetical protein [Arsenicibacter rosenii]OIN55518.1 hypothetical protein BLX24_29820 [Arsenicibacter rosenii]
MEEENEYQAYLALFEKEINNAMQKRLLDANQVEPPVATWEFVHTRVEEFSVRTLADWMTVLPDCIQIVKKFALDFSIYKANINPQIEMQIWLDTNQTSRIEDSSAILTEGMYVIAHYADQLLPFAFTCLNKISLLSPKFSDAVKIVFKIGGLIEVGQDKFYYPTLVMFELKYAALFCVYIKNFAFLPNNPITRQKHYELWAANAPRLASCINSILSNPNFEFINEIETDDYGCFDRDNPGYLQNLNLNGVSWDEFYIPYELLDKAKAKD